MIMVILLLLAQNTKMVKTDSLNWSFGLYSCYLDFTITIYIASIVTKWLFIGHGLQTNLTTIYNELCPLMHEIVGPGLWWQVRLTYMDKSEWSCFKMFQGLFIFYILYFFYKCWTYFPSISSFEPSFIDINVRVYIYIYIFIFMLKFANLNRLIQLSKPLKCFLRPPKHVHNTSL